MSDEYQPGVCNIGKQEINYRKKVVGYGSAVIAAALYTMLVFFNFPVILYALLVIPVFISMHGINEAKHRFCTNYARTGRYNMTSEIGLTQNVLSHVKRKKDNKFARKLVVQSAGISLLISACLLGLSRFIN